MILIKYIPCLAFGLLIYFLVLRPINKAQLREQLKHEGHILNKLKWYEWFL